VDAPRHQKNLQNPLCEPPAAARKGGFAIFFDGAAHPNLRAQVRLGDCLVFRPFSGTLRLIPVCGRGVSARDGG
jgi:hypothetical protein